MRAAGKVITLVRILFARTFCGAARSSPARLDGIERELERHQVVPVGASNRDIQMDPMGVYDDVSLAAERAPARWVLPPRGLKMLTASRRSRAQSI